MVECRNYRVAEHLFSITTKNEYFALMTNYEPFQVEPTSVQQSSLLFALVVETGEMPTCKTKHFFTDQSDADMPRIEIETYDEGWVIGVSIVRDSPICCQIKANKDFSQATLYLLSDKNVRFAIDNAAMLLYAFTSAKLHTLEMHASVVVREGKGYLFLGKSGTGKSTHSRQWMKAFPDVWLLNDDNPIIRFYPAHADEQAKAIVYGSPWSGKTPCYKNEQAPIGGIVKLTQAPYNKANALRLPEAYAFVLTSASGLKIIPEAMDALYETISQMIMVVPMYGLECLPDTAAAECCYEALS